MSTYKFCGGKCPPGSTTYDSYMLIESLKVFETLNNSMGSDKEVFMFIIILSL